MAHKHWNVTAKIIACNKDCAQFDDQICEWNNKIRIEINTRVVITVNKHQLKVLPKQPATGTYNVIHCKAICTAENWPIGGHEFPNVKSADQLQNKCYI